MSDNSIFSERAINLEPAKYQWRRAARLAIDVSRTDNLALHRQAVQIAEAAIARIADLVEAAARQTGD